MSKPTIIPIGPYHPLQEEPELFKLYCDGEIVRDIKWETGYNHRGIEKLSESKTFDQVFFLVERVCGICSTSHPFAFANCMEEIAEVVGVNERTVRRNWRIAKMWLGRELLGYELNE